MKKNLSHNKKEGKSVYYDLAPISSMAPEEESIQALKWAIENPNIHNVALSGPYGSGKSSVIKSYLAQYDIPKIYKVLKHIIPSKKLDTLNFIPKSSRKNLQISLATFDEKKIDDEELQRGILKQLFYKVDASKIPLSRYRKLHHIKWYRYVLAIMLTVLLIFSGMYLIFPQKVSMSWALYWDDVKRVGVIRRIMLAVFLLGGSSYLLWLLTSRFRIKSISVGDVTAEGKSITEESVLDQNIDEILYFFEKTKYKVVFIEDLDRFGNTEIFVKLRELNDILNDYEVLEKRGKITFVYAVKDDLFSKEAERTKFFDFIIPVIPVINSTNSDVVMKELLEIEGNHEKNKVEVSHEISENFIKQVYPFVRDMRTLINIVNEFWFYKRTLKTDSEDKLDDEKIMALMIYKNLYPKDFAELEDEKGKVKEAFEYKEKLIEKQNEKFKKQKEDILQIIESAPSSVREMKKLILLEFRKNIPEEAHSFAYETASGTYKANKILEEEFSMDVFRQGKIRVEYYRHNFYNHAYTDWFTIHSSDELESLFERYDQYKKYEINSVEEAKKKLEELGKNLQKLRASTLQQLLTDRQVEEELPEGVKQNKLLLFLLRKGYINENYADYINYFREGTISKEELNFIRMVRNNQSEQDFHFTIHHHANVIDKLFDYEFEQVELLNFSLMDYMLQKCVDSSQLKILIKQVTNSSKEFINGYLECGQCISEFIKQITAASEYIWKDIVETTLLTEEQKRYDLSAILNNALIEDIIENDLKLSEAENGIIAQYICSKPNIFKEMLDISVDKWIQIILELELDFYEVNLQDVDRQIVDAIIGNQAYQINPYMIKEIVRVLAPEYLPELFVKNYYCLRMLNRSEILDYIEQYMDTYVETITIGEASNVKESTKDVEKMLDALFNKKQGTDPLCTALLEKEEEIHWDTFAQFLPQQDNAIYLWDDLLRNNRITATWENCMTYYDKEKEITSVLCEYIDQNIDDIFENKEESFNMPHEFLKKLLMSNIEDDAFEKIISSYSLDASEYACYDFAFAKNKLELMIRRNYILFSVEKLNELKEISVELWMLYIENHQVDFLDNISKISLELEDVKKLIGSDLFVGQEIITILDKIDDSAIDEELAEILLELSEQKIFEKHYVEAVWDNLPESHRYKWLYDQMQVYDLDELANHFSQLEATYHQFAQRTLHKYKVHNNDYNALLCEKLKKRGFLTSVNYKGDWIEGYVKRGE